MGLERFELTTKRLLALKSLFPTAIQTATLIRAFVHPAVQGTVQSPVVFTSSDSRPIQYIHRTILSPKKIDIYSAHISEIYLN